MLANKVKAHSRRALLPAAACYAREIHATQQSHDRTKRVYKIHKRGGNKRRALASRPIEHIFFLLRVLPTERERARKGETENKGDVPLSVVISVIVVAGFRTRAELSLYARSTRLESH